jgi:hypothetical protein
MRGKVEDRSCRWKVGPNSAEGATSKRGEARYDASREGETGTRLLSSVSTGRPICMKP